MTGFSPITLKLFQSEVPVSMLFSKILFLVLHPTLPAQSLAELLAELITLPKARTGHKTVATIRQTQPDLLDVSG
jgi:hypothetical protein